VSRIGNNKKSPEFNAWAGMYSIMSYLSTADYPRFLKKLTVENIDNLHTNFKELNTYRTKDVTSGTFDIDLEDAVNIMFSIWLDGTHDKYITSKFSLFMESEYCTHYFTNTHRKAVLDYIQTKGPTPYMLELFSIRPDLKTHFKDGTGKKEGWEGELKSHIPELFKIGHEEVENGIIAVKEAVGKKRLYLSIDQEGEKQISLSTLVHESLPFANKTRMVNAYITPGNILDPGHSMVSAGILHDLTNIVQENDAGFEFMYYISPFSVDFKLNDNSFFNVNLQLRIPPQSTTAKPPVGDFFDLSLNGVRVKAGATNALAKSGGPEEKAGKLLGDGLQYLIMAFQNSSQFLGIRRPTTRRSIRAFGTGDAMAFTNYLFFSKLMGVKQAPGIIDFANGARRLCWVVNIPEVEKASQVKRFARSQRSGSLSNSNNNRPENNSVNKKQRLNRPLNSVGSKPSSPNTRVFPSPTRIPPPLPLNNNKFNRNYFLKLVRSPEGQQAIRNEDWYKELINRLEGRNKLPS